jgi:hypothetical protein
MMYKHEGVDYSKRDILTRQLHLSTRLRLMEHDWPYVTVARRCWMDRICQVAAIAGTH